MQSTGSNSEALPAFLRFGFRACVFGLIAAYAFALPLKWSGLYPAHLTWLGVLVFPAAIFTLIGSFFGLQLRFNGRWWIPYSMVSLICCGAMLAVIWWERGW